MLSLSRRTALTMFAALPLAAERGHAAITNAGAKLAAAAR